MRIDRRRLILAGMASVVAQQAGAASKGEALVAVATNFARAAEALKPVFESATGYSVTFASGSTGTLYAQISNGAPYDMLLAADQLRPQLLEQAGLGQGRQTYARGMLTLWQPQAGDIGEHTLRQGGFVHLSIANPALAPYGQAAREALMALGLWEDLQGRIVMGQNVGQAFALVASGNAELGFVAQSYAMGQGAGWLVPERLYSPILQDAVLLSEAPAATAFMAFLATKTAQEIIRAAGYGQVGP